MPYNNAPIAPPEEITGTSTLPLARVKKIIAMDDDIAQCSNTAAFAVSVATEIFIRYLTEQAYNVVKSERKPRRNIAYKDVATAIARVDNLEFLSDVVPKTKTYRQFKEEKALEEAAAKAGPVNGVNGENVSASVGASANAAGSRSIQHMMQHQQQQQQQQQSQQHAPPQTNGYANGTMVNGHGHAPHSPMADRTVHHGHPDPVRDLDVEMTG